jgi:multisubunit Na+/H+ antiporter MnhB subunit
MLRRFATIVLPRTLGLEALYSAFWIARLLPSLAVRDSLTVLLVSIRGTVSAVELIAAWALLRRSPGGPLLAGAALGASAVLTVLETGWRLVPTNLDPTWRWGIVGAYAVYAVLGIWALRSASSGG